MDLRLARMKKGLSQRDLAKIIGIDPSLLSQYEHKRRRPSIETAKKIADVLDIYWADIYEEDKDGNSLQTVNRLIAES